MAAEIPTEIAWLVPLAFPFLIGLFAGIIVKRGIKLVLGIVALVIVLIATGYVSLSFKDVYNRAMDVLPRIFKEARGTAGNVLPISTPAFLIGLAIGLWIG